MPHSDDLYLGVDPGKSGAFAIVDADGAFVEAMRLDQPLQDIARWLGSNFPRIRFAMLERVSSRPGQGVSSTFKFGQSFGHCEALLAAYCIPHELVTPTTWQRKMKCLSGGDKKVTKAAALRLWPKDKITHREADAMLLAEYCRRVRLGVG